jgi:hypothetical protein
MKTLLRKVFQAKLALFGALLMTTALLGSKASADTIYSQTFTGGATPIVGTAPTTGGGTWEGANIINSDGNTTGDSGAISLPFTPQSGFIYDLTANINVTTGDSSWLGVGFLNHNDDAFGFLPPANTPAALRRIAGWEIWPQNAAFSVTNNAVTVRLDTTGAQWKTAMFQGGVQIGSTYTYTTNPTINHVGFVSEGTVVGSVSAFNLTATAVSVIYSQDFPVVGDPLLGTTSTVGGGTWSGVNLFNIAGYTTGSSGAIALPFNPQSGYIYDLTATINIANDNGSWIGAGFLSTIDDAYGFTGSPNSSAAIRNGGAWTTFPGGGNGITSTDLRIRLDTTGAQWVTSFYQGGVQMGSAYTYTSGNPSINYVGFVSEGTAVGSASAFQLTATAVSNSPTFASWASTNAGGQTANLDWDNDGVTNGVEYFMNAAPGFTSNPALVDSTVTWPNGGNIPSSAYGSQFVVQTSANLVNWIDVPSSGDANLVNTSGSVAYTLTGPGKNFVRLKVTPN